MAPEFMSTAVFEQLTITPDLIRLLIILAFVYAAILDYRTRRVYNEFWIPLIGLCFIVLGWDIALLLSDSPLQDQDYLLSLSLSIIIAPSIAYTLWERGILGGADLKAIAFLSIFFPQIPEMTISGTTYPLVEGATTIFTLTVLVNALILTATYKLVIVLRNLNNKDISRLMTRATRCNTGSIDTAHGDILETNNGRIESRVDIDTIRMYLQWRGITLEQLRSTPEFYRELGPFNEKKFNDGAPSTISNTPLGHSSAEFQLNNQSTHPRIIPVEAIDHCPEDLWAASRFITVLSEVHPQLNVSKLDLRRAIEAIVTEEKVWISPAVPFFIPLTIGLVIALTYGSLFTGLTELITTGILELAQN